MAAKTGIPNSKLYLGALVSAAIGVLILLLTDFAGWEEGFGSLGTSVSPSRTGSAAQNLTFTPKSEYVSSYIALDSAYFPLVVLMAGLLGYAGYTAWQGMRKGDPGVARIAVKRGFLAAMAASGLSLAVGVIFSLAMMAGDADWWLDWGFYGGLLLGALSAALLGLALRRHGRPHDATA